MNTVTAANVATVKQASVKRPFARTVVALLAFCMLLICSCRGINKSPVVNRHENAPIDNAGPLATPNGGKTTTMSLSDDPPQQSDGTLFRGQNIAPAGHAGPMWRGPHGYAQLPYDAIYHPPVGQDEFWSPPYIRRPWPKDEYLFDGGDQDLKVEVDPDWTVRGLHMEDTVGHFDTLHGETVVVPTNRVPIYAPRFAAVRKTFGFVAHEGHEKATGVDVPMQAILQADLQIATTAIQRAQAEVGLGSKQASVFRDRTRDIPVTGRQNVLEAGNKFMPFEDFQIIRFGIFEQGEKARLAQAVDAALVWQTKQAVQVAINGEQALAQKSTARLEQTYLYERPKGKPRLRIVKVASASDAKPGEEISFTIRFDNVGGEVIGNVTVVDNLTTRLEYIPDTAECSINADFFTEENEGESLVLRWEIIDPLENGKGGTIRFKCIVR